MGNAQKSKTPSDKELLEKAERLINKGNLSTASDIYLKFLKKNNSDPNAMFGMGRISQKAGHYDKALGFFEKLIEAEPSNSKYHTQQGATYILMGDLNKGLESLQKALSLNDKDVEAWSYISELYVQTNKLEEFETYCQGIIKKNPNSADAWCAVGSIHTIKLEYEKALPYYLKAIELDDTKPGPFYNAGNIYHWLGQFAEAIEYYKKAVKLDPTMYEAVENLATTYVVSKQPEKAVDMVKELLKKSKDQPNLLLMLAQAYRGMDDNVRAYETNRRMMDLYPTEAAYAENALLDAMTMEDDAKMDEMMKKVMNMPNISSNGVALVYNTARKRNDWQTAHAMWDKLLVAIEEPITKKSQGRNFANLNLISDPWTTIPAMRKAHEKAAEALRRMLPQDWKPDHSKAFEPASRVRIGVVSGDFYSHVVSHFANGLFKFHDRSRFELFAYANVPEKKRDPITKAYQATAEHFMFVDKMNPRELAEQIQSDGIHILLDLSGFTEGNLFEMLIYKPAPVIATWLGYPATTGCKEIDYVISDRWADSPEHDELFVEKALPLEDSIYVVGEYPNAPAVVDPPMLKNGYITFGSLMNPYKMNPDLIKAWSEIMNRVPTARMKLIHPRLIGVAKNNLEAEFKRQGFPMERLEFISKRHKNKGHHLWYYNDLDVTLDTFPQTGGTTTFESLVMNVPVVTKVGKVLLERLSNSIIHNSGISTPELLTASTDQEYIDKAVALAENPETLLQIRAELRSRINASNLFSPRKHTRQLEEALQRGWDQKFPDMPLSKLLTGNFEDDEARNKIRRFQLNIEGYPIAFLTFDSEHDQFNYILNEQEGWFDPEYHFVLNLLKEGESFVDFSDDPGIYAFPIAYKVGLKGKVNTYSRSSDSRFFIEMMKPDNVVANRYEVTEDPIAEHSDAALIRINSEFNDDGKGGLIGKKIDELAKNEPIIFFSTRYANEFDWTMLSKLENAGFNIYRYMPGLDALTPFDKELDADTFLSTLFACKGKREAELQAQGKLVLKETDTQYHPDLLATPFLDWLKDKPYARPFYDDWKAIFSTEKKDTAIEVYAAALNAWAVSTQADTPLTERYSALLASISFLDPLVAAAPDSSVMLTLARVLSDAGRRESAVLVLSQLKKQFEDGTCNFDLPFLPASSDWDMIDPEEKIAEWLFAGTLETFEFLRAFSSFFVGKAQLEPLQLIQSMGFYREPVARRIELLRQRFL